MLEGGEAAEIIAWVFFGHQGAFRGVLPIIEAGKQEAQRCPLAEQREGALLGLGEWANRLIAAQQGSGFGAVEGIIRLEAPSIEADSNVEREKIGGREIEIDQARDFAIEEKYIVGEQIGMDLAVREGGGPGRDDAGHGVIEGGLQAGFDRVGMVAALRPERCPGGGAERIGACCRVIGAGLVELGEGGAEFGAMGDGGLAWPDAGEKGGDGGGFAGEAVQIGAIARTHRQRAGQAVLGEMFEQAKEPGEIGRIDPLFVEGQDEIALGGAQGVIAVFHAFGNAAKGDGFAQIILGEEGVEHAIGDFGIYGH